MSRAAVYTHLCHIKAFTVKVADSASTVLVIAPSSRGHLFSPCCHLVVSRCALHCRLFMVSPTLTYG